MSNIFLWLAGSYPELDVSAIQKALSPEDLLAIEAVPIEQLISQIQERETMTNGVLTYRGRQITPAEVESLQFQLQRLNLDGLNIEWVEGEPTFGQHPNTWISDEAEYLAGL